MSDFENLVNAVINNRAIMLTEGGDGSIQLIGTYNSILDEEFKKLEEKVEKDKKIVTVNGAYIGI